MSGGGYLQITFVDAAANEFRTVGGAGFPTMAETRRRFRAIPAVADSDLILDLLNRDGDILDNKPISKATAEALMGEPLAAISQRGHRPSRPSRKAASR